MVRAGIGGIGKMSWEKLTLRHVQNTNTHPATIPVFIYGTAWKKDRTADLVHQAINSGFRAVDTAAQPKHYREDLVGEGIRRAIKEGTVRREDLHVCAARIRWLFRLLTDCSGPNQVYFHPGPGPEQHALRSHQLGNGAGPCFPQVIPL